MTNVEESIRGIMMLKLFIRRIKRFLLPSASASKGSTACDDGFHEEMELENVVPDDVKKGHFAVRAIKGEEPKRFIVELGYLTDPAFLSLLEQAKEEYGFQQAGVLAIRCGPEELQKILNNRRKRRASTGW